MQTIKLILSGLFCLLLSLASAQNRPKLAPCETAGFSCPDYSKMEADIYRLLNQKKALEAYDVFQLLDVCDDCPEHQDELQEMGQLILEELKQEFEEKVRSAEAALAESEKNKSALEATVRNLDRAKQRTARQLELNERITRDALATNYMKIANSKLDEETERGYDAAVWLTDFTYAYIDSTHEEVQQMMYRLFQERLIDNLPYDYYNEAEDGQEYQEEEVIVAMDWSPDSLWLAMGTTTGRTIIYASDGTVAFNEKLEDFSTGILHLDWNYSSSKLAIAASGTVYLIALGKKTWLLNEKTIQRPDYIRSVAWSPNDQDMLAVGGDESVVFVYGDDWVQAETTFPHIHNDWVRSVSWSPDGAQLASASDDGRVIVWSMDGTKSSVVSNVKLHQDYVRSVVWHPTEVGILASGADDGTIHTHNVEGNITHTQKLGKLIVKMAFSASGEQLAVMDNFWELTIFQEDTEGSVKFPAAPGLSSFAWRGETHNRNLSGPITESIKLDGSFILPELNQAAPENFISEDEFTSGEIREGKWSPDGELFAYTQDSYNLLVQKGDELHRVYTGSYTTGIDWHPGLSEQLPNSNYFARIDESGNLQIWDAFDLAIKKSKQLPNLGLALAWSPNGTELAIGDDIGTLSFYDQDLQLVAGFPLKADYGIYDLSWSPNGRYLAVTTNDNTVTLWDRSQQQKQTVLAGHNDRIIEVIWLDNSSLATCNTDKTVLIWQDQSDSGNYQIIQTLNELTGTPISATYQNSGQYSALTIGTSDGELGFWLRNNTPGQRFALDTVVDYALYIDQLNLHPNGREIAINSYSKVPQLINYAREVAPVFDLTSLKLVERSLEDIDQAEYLNLQQAFYLPEITIPNTTQHLLQWSKDERFLAFVTEQTLEVHDFVAREKVHTYPLNDPPTKLSFSPDDQLLVTLDTEGQISLLSTDSWAAPQLVQLEFPDIMSWAWSDNSRYLALLRTDFNIYLYDRRNGQVTLHQTQLEESYEGILSFSPQQDNLLLILSRNKVYTYDLQVEGATAKRIHKTDQGSESQEGDKMVIHWLGDGQEFLLKLPNELLKVLSLDGNVQQEFGSTGSLAAPFQGLVSEYSPMQEYNAPFTSSQREYVKFWNPRTNLIERKLLGIRHTLATDLALSEASNQLAAMGRPLKLEGGKHQPNYNAPITLNIWDIDKKIQTLSLPVNGAKDILFSPLGNYITVHFSGGQVAVWPLELSAISAYLSSAGKDRFLSNRNKEENSFQSRIEDWNLEQGINVAPQENTTRLKRREAAPLRADWSAFFVEKAWLVDNLEQAEDYFARAFEMHLTSTDAIRNSATDSAAVARIDMEQVLFFLAKNKDDSAQRFLRSARKKLPTAPSLQQLELLLNWHNGEQKNTFAVMSQIYNDTLNLVYDTWKTRNLILNDNPFFERILNTTLHTEDPALATKNSPSIADLTRNFDQEARYNFLYKYYNLNAASYYLNEQEQQDLATEALDLFNDHLSSVAPDDKVKLQAHYYSIKQFSDNLKYSYQMQEKYGVALNYAQQSLLAAEKLYLAYEEKQAETDYFLSIAEYGVLSLAKKPNDRQKVTQVLERAERLTGEKDHPYADLLRGFMVAIDGNSAKALSLYAKGLSYSLEIYENTYYFTELLNRSHNALGGALTTTTRQEIDQGLNKYNNYYSAYTTYLYELKDYLFSQDGTDDLANLARGFEACRTLKNNYSTLASLDFILFVTPQEIAKELSAVGSKLTWAYLKGSNVEDANSTKDRVKESVEKAQWSIAFEAIYAVLQDDWLTAKEILTTRQNLPNDGYNQEDFPILKDLLLSENLPQSVLDHPNFLKHQVAWEAALQ